MNPTAHNGAWYMPGHAFDYLSAGETATDTFAYTVSDGHGGTSTTTATVTITGVNVAPTATPISASTDTTHGIWLNLTAGIHDINADDHLAITSVNTGGVLGQVNWSAATDTGVWYNPGAAFQGLAAGQTATDTFSYSVSDGHGGTTTNTATVTVTGVAPQATPSKVLYVATDGNDKWSGRLAQPNAAGTDGPLASLNAAHWDMEGGSTPRTVYIEGGTYTAGNPENLLSRDDGETWSNYDGQKVTINSSSLGAFGVYGAQNVTISGLTILAAPGSTGIQVSGSSNVTVKNMTIVGGSNAIEDDKSGSNIQLLDNDLQGQSANGIFITSGVNNVTADGNYIHETGTTSLGDGIWFDGSSNDVFSNNFVENTGKMGIGGGSVVGTSDASYNDVITHNTITHANMMYQDAGAIDLFGEQQDATGDTVSFNTVSDTSLGNPNAWIGPGIYLDDFVSNVNVYGNLLKGNYDGIYTHLGLNNTIDHNVITGSTIGLVMTAEQNNGRVPLYPSSGNVFSDNTVYVNNPTELMTRIADGPTAATWLNNIYGGPGTGGSQFQMDINHATTNYNFGQWVAMGYDASAATPSPGMTIAQALSNLPTS